jgi:hypothetical protein
MALIRDEQIEVEARAILRESIERSGWYSALRKKEWEKLIQQDVERHWHLMIRDAVKQRQRAEPNY